MYMMSAYNLITSSFWPVAGLWLFLSLADYGLCVFELRLYRKLVKDHISLFDGSELNPFHGRSLSVNRWGPQALVLPVGGYLLLLATSAVGHRYEGTTAWEFACGMVLCFMAVNFVRHVRWLVFFSLVSESAEKAWIHGRIECSPSYFTKQYAIDFLFMALMCLGTYGVCPLPLFLGGSLSTVLAAITCWRYASS